MEEAEQLLQVRKRKFMTPIVELVLNEVQLEEGSCSKAINQTEP